MSCAAPNKIDIVPTSCRIICCRFAVGAPWLRKGLRLTPHPKSRCLHRRIGAEQILWKIDRHVSMHRGTSGLARPLERRALQAILRLDFAFGPAAKEELT